MVTYGYVVLLSYFILYLYNYIIIYHVPVKRYANNKKHPSNHCILTK